MPLRLLNYSLVRLHLRLLIRLSPVPGQYQLVCWALEMGNGHIDMGEAHANACIGGYAADVIIAPPRATLP